MAEIRLHNINIDMDFENGCINSLSCFGKELTESKLPIFRVRLMDKDGNFFCTDAFEAKNCTIKDNGAEYSGFSVDIIVDIKIADSSELYISVENNTDMLIEWIDFPVISLKPLVKNGGNATVLFPYNEGAIVDDAVARQQGWFPDCVPEYPSSGSYCVFPNMVFSQFMCYLFDGYGVYLGAHDKERGVKGVHFHPVNNGIEMYFKLYCDGDFSKDYKSEFPVALRGFEGDWHDGADIYREWFEENLPIDVKKIKENDSLPDWYEESPLVITYPVRGVHDMDEMKPNALFPYNNALPLVDEIASKVNSNLMVILMHWEGTAPWAPPYVWPPYGGEDIFNSFADNLHERGHKLGVYCSGFGFTKQSNLIEEYNNEERIENENLYEAMCASPSDKVEISNICQGQRSGYDLCLGSDKAQEILDRAYTPLFESKVDYVQILDQNHGGGQYFCYSRNHNHTPAPGKWMTEQMCKLLRKWREKGGNKLFGCESSAAEAFMGNLLFSDNRYELNWHFGKPIELYSYLYHEYIRNFMGNQVSCGLLHTEDTLCLRMAYSFVAGDCMTLVVTPDGEFMSNWGNHDFDIMPDKENALKFAANMQKFYSETAKPYLYAGRMIKAKEYRCEKMLYHRELGGSLEIDNVFSTAWETDGKKVQIFVNHTPQTQKVEFMNKKLNISGLSAVIEYI